MPATPVVPETITVHLGPPGSSARNVEVPFAAYIKNVASHEIYPTWPESAIRANILAQISYALNRVYTEYYRTRGYDYDITSTTQYDQAYVDGGDVFENISQIVDDSFNNYIVRQGSVEPLFAQFCDGVRTQCGGLSQWGSVDLARDGMNPYEILQYYYGGDISIVFNAPVGGNVPSYPGRPLRRGDVGNDVLLLQRQLSRIRRNYPAIPEIPEPSTVFDVPMEEAVKSFQQIFNLTPDGIVGKATWYKIKQIYNGVKGLSELSGEGLTISEVQRQYTEALRLGDSGLAVRTVRFSWLFWGISCRNCRPSGSAMSLTRRCWTPCMPSRAMRAFPPTAWWAGTPGTPCGGPMRTCWRTCRRTISSLPGRFIRGGSSSWGTGATRYCFCSSS